MSQMAGLLDELVQMRDRLEAEILENGERAHALRRVPFNLTGALP